MIQTNRPSSSSYYKLSRVSSRCRFGARRRDHYLVRIPFLLWHPVDPSFLEQAARLQATAQRHARAHGLEESTASTLLLLLVALVVASSIGSLLRRVSALRVATLIVLHALILIVATLLRWVALLIASLLRVAALLLIWRGVVVIPRGTSVGGNVRRLGRGDVTRVGAVGWWGSAAVLRHRDYEGRAEDGVVDEGMMDIKRRARR